MKMFNKIFLLLVVLGSIFVHRTVVAKIITSEPSNTFGYALLKNIAATEEKNDANKNIFISPISASLALSMLLQGAQTSTYDSIAKALQIHNIKAKDILESNQELIKLLTAVSIGGEQSKASPLVLNISNSIWASSTAPFQYNPKYVEEMQQYYSATVEKTNFRSQVGVDAINKWAGDKTNQKIKNVINLDTLKDMWFVLMNATYFKASWAKSFDQQLTKKKEFTTAKNEKVEVEMMKKNGRENYYEDDEVQVVKLYYKDFTASMYIVLPKDGYSLSNLLAKNDGVLSSKFWNNVSIKMDTRRGTVEIPKFSFPYSIKLNDVLMSMGMGVAFSDAADFSAIGDPAAKVSLVKQDTFIKVDEVGTEAAAVTLIGGMRAVSIDLNTPFQFIANKPFFVSIVKNPVAKDEAETVLFMGTVNKPEWK